MRYGPADHWRESYGREPGKSMKAVELAAPQEDGCCKISISLNDRWAVFRLDRCEGAQCEA